MPVSSGATIRPAAPVLSGVTVRDDVFFFLWAFGDAHGDAVGLAVFARDAVVADLPVVLAGATLLLGWLVAACGFAVTSEAGEGLLPVPEPVPGELVSVDVGVGVAVAVGVGVTVDVGVGLAVLVGLVDAGGWEIVDLSGPGVGQAGVLLNRPPEVPGELIGPEPLENECPTPPLAPPVAPGWLVCCALASEPVGEMTCVTSMDI